MSREIKFRAWDKIGRNMVDWAAMRQTAFNRGEYQILYKILVNHADNFVIMQFTGLKDKNGKEIYEGDILHFKTYSGGGFATSGIDVYNIVEFGEFTVRNNTLYQYSGFFATRTTHEDTQSIKYLMGHGAVVVGNIHENPELLTA